MTRLTTSAPIHEAAHPLTDSGVDLDPLLRKISNARYVLLGEASHGTHEFYKVRADITKRLITEHGFSAVAVEADWPDAHRANQFVHARGDDTSAGEALSGFHRFPQWMWRNRDVEEFVAWLRAHNDEQPDDARRAGFYGLDLYSLHTSVDAVIEYLRIVDPEGATRAIERYSCFDHACRDLHRYAMDAESGMSRSCEREVIAQLIDIQRSAGEYLLRDGHTDADAHFYAEHNARVVRNAEAYYRAAVSGSAAAWNLRDRHMAETLSLLVTHLDQTKSNSKVVVWAHNSHLGDASWTEMARRGELNLGQLVREVHPQETQLLGFTTYTGTVTAASHWGTPPEEKRVRPALDESYEALFHSTGLGNFMLMFEHGTEIAWSLEEPRLERAIGVIYRPETERASHYFVASLSRQFDGIIHIDETTATTEKHE